MSALSFQPAERDVRYQTTIQHHWSKKWKHFSWSASGTKFRILMATIGLPSTSDYSDYSKLKLYITDRTSVSLDISFRWSSDITPMNFPRGKPEMERTQQSRFSSCNNAIWTCLPCFFFFVCPPTRRTASGQTNCISEFRSGWWSRRPRTEEAFMLLLWNVVLSIHKQRVENCIV